MRLSRAGWILTALVLLTCAGAALDVNIQNEKPWLTAGSDSGRMSIQILPGPGETGPYELTFTVENPDFCSVAPLDPTTSTSVQTTVFSGIKSGTCSINVGVKDKATDHTASRLQAQKIDHAAPATVEQVLYSEAQAGTVVPVWIRIRDKHGNLVDNRNIAESAIFTAFGAGGFTLGAYSSVTPLEETVTVPVDGGGVATALYYVGDGGKTNYIRYTPPGGLMEGSIFFWGALNGKPAAITSSIVPNAATPPWVYADDKSRFTITYAVSDENGFPVEKTGITVEKSVGSTVKVQTGPDGRVAIYHGPSKSPARHYLTATCDANRAVSVKDTVDFISGNPDHMLVTANPITMPSLEINPTYSIVTARVGDAKGNPVSGEKVSFSITKITAPKALINAPYLATNGVPDGRASRKQTFDAVTDQYGNAMVYFIPGEFTADPDSKDYLYSAEGTAVVEASWGSKKGDKSQKEEILLTFRNSAFLTLRTQVFKQDVNLGDSVNVTITVVGDGAMTKTDPIDVVLIIDRSGSMGSNLMSKDKVVKKKIDWVKQAAKAFVGQLNPAKDRVGLVTFETHASLDHELSSDFTSVNNTIDQLQVPAVNQFIPFSGPTALTNMRDGIFNGTTHVKMFGRQDPKVVKAIVVLSDGVFNWYGTPLGKGRGYAQKTRVVSWTDNFFGNTCGWPAGCENTYFKDRLYWPGGTSFFMYTYFNPDLYPGVMTDPGPLYYTGTGWKAASKASEGGGGHICHPQLVGFDNHAVNAWSPVMCDRDGLCNDHIQCTLGNDRYRVDVCDADYMGGRDCEFTDQNMSVLAKRNNVRIYTISYNYNNPTAVEEGTKDVLKILSASTSGLYYNAPSPEDLQEIYKNIALDLIRSAGVSTKIIPNSVDVFLDRTTKVLGKDAFQYIWVPDHSTNISSWNKTHTKIAPYTKDQTADWNNNQQLPIDIGTIEIGQTWQMNYRLKTLMGGVFNVFGPASKLVYLDRDGNPTTVLFPETLVNVRDGSVPNAPVVLDIQNLRVEPASPLKDNTAFDIKWNLLYTNPESDKTVFQDIKIRGIGSTQYEGPPIRYDPDLLPDAQPQPCTLPIGGGLPLGEYSVEIHAHGPTSDSDTTFIKVVTDPGAATIKIF